MEGGDNLFRVTERKSFFELGDKFFSEIEIKGIQDGLRQIAVSNPTVESVTVESTDIYRNQLENATKPENSNSSCGMCGITSFDQRTDLINHFKSEWHKFNLKLQMRGVQSVSLDEFELLQSQKEEEDSGSSSEEEEENKNQSKGLQLHRSPKIVFSSSDGRKLAVWKRVLIETGQDPASNEHIDYVSLLKKIPQKKKWTFLMSSGGHFAGGIFEGNKLVKHKTFHRYTTRKKQGGSQSAKDNQSSHSIKSAGSNIRRQNEVKLKEDIAEVLLEWKASIDSSQLIFVCAPGIYNIRSFYFKDSPIVKGDNRTRSVPFTTRRPTLVEIKRAFQILSSVEFLEAVDLNDDRFSLKDSIEEDLEVKDLLKEMDLEEEEENEKEEEMEKVEATPEPKVEENLMLKAVKNGDLDELKRLWEEDYFPPVTPKGGKVMTPLYLALETGQYEISKYLIEVVKQGFNIEIPSKSFRTPLHAASASGFHDLIEALIREGADPSVRGMDGKTPFDVSKDKETSLWWRKFAGRHHTMFKWTSFGVQPTTDEIEAEKLQKELEKKALQKEKKKEKQKKRKEEEKKEKLRKNEEAELAKINEERENAMKNMSEREKRAMAAENRIAMSNGTIKKCNLCDTPLTMVPFVRLDYHYCSMKCLNDHRTKLEATSVPSKKKA
eukprot:TRINITY_DN3806_c0_g1_i3.p1 TRINITY_DN3806_c0_g1~~TRINITY_DN3806_c0_g1_i3.p1  ORF type:complete len:664 (+),score=278.14 TRINITY_DN3806_c0_g1_i3:127-2118(+)